MSRYTQITELGFESAVVWLVIQSLFQAAPTEPRHLLLPILTSVGGPYWISPRQSSNTGDLGPA